KVDGDVRLRPECLGVRSRQERNNGMPLSGCCNSLCVDGLPVACEPGIERQLVVRNGRTRRDQSKHARENKQVLEGMGWSLERLVAQVLIHHTGIALNGRDTDSIERNKVQTVCRRCLLVARYAIELGAFSLG